MKGKIIFAVAVLLVGMFGFSGCGSKADENKPVSEIQAEAAKMDAEKLKAMAIKYKDAIVAKQADLEKITEELAKIPLTEKLGEEAKALSTELEDLGRSVKALKERFSVYYDEIKKKGGDLKGLEI